MNKGLAHFFSGAFHPLLIPTLLFAFLFTFYPQAAYNLTFQGQVYFVGVIFVTTFLLPGLAIMMLRTSNTISSVLMERREERIIPFIIITLVYFIIAYMFAFYRSFNTLVSAVVIGMALISLLLTIITFFFKISVHAATISGVIGFALGTQLHYAVEGNFVYIVSLLVLFAGLVSSSRLSLDAHKPNEILAGIIVGFSVSLISVLLFLNP